jgi:hypothetical protein
MQIWPVPGLSSVSAAGVRGAHPDGDGHGGSTGTSRVALFEQQRLSANEGGAASPKVMRAALVPACSLTLVYASWTNDLIGLVLVAAGLGLIELRQRATIA